MIEPVDGVPRFMRFLALCWSLQREARFVFGRRVEESVNRAEARVSCAEERVNRAEARTNRAEARINRGGGAPVVWRGWVPEALAVRKGAYHPGCPKRN